MAEVVARQARTFVEVGALGRPVVKAARELLDEGLDPAQASSLFTQTAAELAKKPGGLSRAEWLELCAELYDGFERQGGAGQDGGRA